MSTFTHRPAGATAAVPSAPPSPLRTALAVAAVLAVGACASGPTTSALLADARSTVERVQGAPEVAASAKPDLDKARQFLGLAEDAAREREPLEIVDHYAYLARQRALVAEQRALRLAAEARIAASEGERARIQLLAREREVERSRQAAAAAEARAAGAQQAAREAASEAERLRLEREAARQAAADLEADLAALQAERTQRGLVVTLGNDVLFDVGRAELKPGSTRAIERLAEFMREHPERSVLVEGFTDATGGDAYNLELSRARADAVRAALVARGIAADRVAAVGHGEQYAIASNSDPGGRQLNRRVEVVISDESGRIASR